MANHVLAGTDILIVEDESLLQKRIAAKLESLSAAVSSASTLHGARDALRATSFDFALLDIGLPDGKGTTLLEEKAFSPTTGVIVMTANGDVSGAVQCMRAGAVDYLVKPFDLLELPLVIARARKTRQ